MSVATSETGVRTLGRLFDAGGESLDAAVTTALQTLAVRGNARCLVCGGTLLRTGDGEAQCSSCATRLD